MKKRLSFTRCSRVVFSLVLLMVSVQMIKAASSDCCAATCSHSFLRHRPVSQDMSLQHGLHKYFLHHQKDVDLGERQAQLDALAKEGRTEKEAQNRLLTVSADLFYHSSTNKKKLRRFYLKECKDCLVVDQPPVGGPDDVNDINSLWLGVAGDLAADEDLEFSSNITLNPSRQVIGSAWSFHFDLDRVLRNTWFDVFVPVVHVRHMARLKETNVVGKGTFRNDLSNATDAFNNKDWCFGRIPCGSQTKTGIDDIKTTFGWHFLERENKTAAWYLNLFIPTHHGSRAKYLFEPTIGTGGHVGIGTGFDCDWTLYEDNDTRINWVNDIRYAYFFSHCEKRSLDLCNNGEWSRYMLVAKSGALDAALPAINFFTRDVKITPRSNIEFLSMFHVEHKTWNVELGYNFWWRQKEKIALKCNEECAPAEVGIFDIVQRTSTPPMGAVTTASTATIEQVFAATRDATPTFVQDTDLNLESGRQPTALTSKLFLAAGYDCMWNNHPMVLGVGFSYEFAHRKAAYQQWGVWFKKGISF